jgi:hypothetical protein
MCSISDYENSNNNSTETCSCTGLATCGDDNQDDRSHLVCSVVNNLHTVLKRPGTRDYNCVKVVWFDRPWLGESLADIHNFLNCPF